ncbi:MAG: vitamin K epoxide reductase family protein [Actinomycetaceae bacterium]|nr:vitamin K epoxide reductase family protein [Actinomycetaceae bacterium]
MTSRDTTKIPNSDSCLPTPHMQKGGAPRWWSAIVALLSIIGTVASVELVMAEQQKKVAPLGELGCDINVLIGCGESILSPEAHLFFGISNSILGTTAFSILAVIAVSLFFRVTLPRSLWWLMLLGAIGAIAMVVFFLWASIVTFKALCPYCLVVWTVSIALFYLILAHVLRLQATPQRPLKGITRLFVRDWWLLLIATYLVVFLIIVIAFFDKFALLL